MLLSLECRGCKATLTADSVEIAATTNESGADNGERNGRTKNDYRKKIKKMMLYDSSDHFSSSAESCDIVGFFCRREEKEAAAILSSTSFSSDSAEYYSHPSSNTTKSKNKNKNKNSTPRAAKKYVSRVEKAKVVAADVKRGVVVEQCSTDTYGDFRRSMVEMIMAKSKLRDADMNRLLGQYLSLNSPEHHPIIIKAFSDIYKGCSLHAAADL